MPLVPDCRKAVGFILTSVIVSVGARPAPAQVSASIEAGGTRIAYDQASGISAASLTPALEVTGPRGSFSASGSFSQFNGGGWSLQGLSTVSVLAPASGSLRLEVGGSGAGSTHQDGTGTGELAGRVRVHWLAAREGIWGGAVVGRSWNSFDWQTTRRLEGAAWLQRDAVTLLGTVTPAWIGDSLRHVDTEGTIRFARGSLELSATGGFRHWTRPSGAAGTTWGSASGVFWLGDHAAAIASGGSYPADYAQGLPGGTYLSVGLRLATRRPASTIPRRIDARTPGEPSRPSPRSFRPAVPAFEVRSSGPDRYQFRVDAPGAKKVEIMGDFTEWRPVALEGTGGDTWAVTLALSPGTYRVNLRVDGGPWGVPPGVTALADDFGGTVGVLRVE
jgi:hypothetical protein